MNRIAFVMPYIGSWPPWSRLFFISAEKNRYVDFILLCEEAPPFAVPNNVYTNIVTKKDIILRLNKATGLALTSITGHKLCDFKPFYGLVFSDFLEKYKFWGFCDFDMMLGDLSKLLTPEFLGGIDVFSAHDKQIVGHFTFVRNNDALNHACFSIEGWQKRCSALTNTALDEIPFGVALNAIPEIRFLQPKSLPDELKNSFARFGITFDFLGNVAGLGRHAPVVAEWNDGATYLISQRGPKKEVLYIHFMGTKRDWHWLFFNNELATKVSHCFSRIGYGGITTVADLTLPRWRFFYWIQRMLQHTKSTGGGLARKLLPEQLFLLLRRRIFGKGRY